jgi:magnesium transporter
MTLNAAPMEDSAQLTADDLRDTWPVLSPDDRHAGFELLPRAEAEEFFLELGGEDQLEVVRTRPEAQRALWLRLLPPDDVVDLLQAADEAERATLLTLLDDFTREEVGALLAYAEDDAGGLMSTRFVRVRPEMTVDEAIRYLRKQARERVETLSYTYVLDAHQKLLGVVSFRELFAAAGDRRISEVMYTDLVTVHEHMDQEEVGRVFAQFDLVAIPVVDADGAMKGIVTIDDIVDVVEEEATEDIQKLGGMAALDAPYFQVSLREMVRARAGWLVVLMIGQMLTATALGHYQGDIAKAVVLAIFLPLVVSCGGNSGSQASTLVTRALAVGDLRLRDWRRVLRRELGASALLGGVLATVGLLRILLWPDAATEYGEFYVGIAAAVGASVFGVVVWGATMGAMLPLVLHRLGLDPASASAPFVATLSDVTGVLIYFTLANLLLSGTLL